MSLLNRILGRRSFQGNQLSKYFPWRTYKEDNHSFLNEDNTIGFIWECRPLFFYSENNEKVLAVLLKQNFPKGTVMQWILYSDPNINHFVDAFLSNKSRSDPLVKKSAIKYANFIKQTTQGCRSLNGIPARNFRLILSLKCESEISLDILSVIEQTLSSSGFSPRRWRENDLLAWAQQIFGGYQTSPASVDHTRPLREQVIQTGTEIVIQKDSVQIGDRYVRCLTPKSLGKTINEEQSNRLFGGTMGFLDDSKQLKTPFLYSLNILFDAIFFEVDKKASIPMGMELNALVEQETFVKIIPSLWVFGESEGQVHNSSLQAIVHWITEADIELQNETTLSAQSLIESLPFGLYIDSKNIKRHFIVSNSTVVPFIPSQVDFCGSNHPVIPLVGRKGQVIGCDLFDERTNSHNFIVSGVEGSGKSFFLNFLCSNYYAEGAKVRIIDTGYSYKKLSKLANGRFLDLSSERICINPFYFRARDEEDAESSLNAVVNVIAEMAYQPSGPLINEKELILIKHAVDWVLQQDRRQEGITAVYEYLKSYPKLTKIDEELPLDMVDNARWMASHLKDLTHTGCYGGFFNGPTNFDISNDDLVVIELDKLRDQTVLFKVVVPQILNSVTQDFYLPDRSSKCIVLFEEFLGQLMINGGTDLMRLGLMINEGYKRARKYQGSFGIVLQSLLDLKTFGPVGDVIKTSADFKFLFQSHSYQDVAKEGIIQYQDKILELIESLHSNRPHYSELFVDTPFGIGIGRLVVDSWNYWVNASQWCELNQFESLLKQGLTPLQSIERLSKGA